MTITILVFTILLGSGTSDAVVGEPSALGACARCNGLTCQWGPLAEPRYCFCESDPTYYCMYWGECEPGTCGIVEEQEFGLDGFVAASTETLRSPAYDMILVESVGHVLLTKACGGFIVKADYDGESESGMRSQMRQLHL